MAACVRSETLSFSRIAATWLLTVSGESTSLSAISRLERPSATSERISRSRLVRFRAADGVAAPGFISDSIPLSIWDSMNAPPVATWRIASIRSSFETSLRRYPAAPARTASRRYAGLSCIVTMITAVRERSSLMRRVASRPSMSGMRTSMSTTSGSSLRALSIASRPVLASPTTVRSSALASMDATPCRTSSWSSTRSTRIGIAGDSRGRSRDGDPEEIEEEARKHDQQNADSEERQRTRGGFRGSCQQAFYSRHQIGRGGVLRHPPPRLVEGSLRSGGLCRPRGEDQSGNAKVRAAITAYQQGVNQSDVRRPASGEIHSIGELRRAAHLVASFEAEDCLDPLSDARMRDDQEDPRSADGRTIHRCRVPLHRAYTVHPLLVGCPGTAEKRLSHSCQSESSSRTTTSRYARASARSSTPTLISRSWARRRMGTRRRARRSSSVPT